MTKMAFALSVLLALAGASAAYAQTVVDSCGQDVESGILTADLDCSASAASYGVKVTRGKLDLGGFTITAPSGGVAVFCGGFGATSCRVTGPGTVIGTILPTVMKAYKLSNLTIHAAGFPDFLGSATRVRLDRVTATGFDRVINGGVRLRITDSQLVGSATSTTGVYSGRTTIVRSSITGFGNVGVESAYSLRLVDTSVTGNGTDIASGSLPKLQGTSTCGTSINYSTFTTWGVCTND
jgi:hypothetical protein